MISCPTFWRVESVPSTESTFMFAGPDTILAGGSTGLGVGWNGGTVGGAVASRVARAQAARIRTDRMTMR